MKRYVLVEGHGETAAVKNLLVRLSQSIGDYLPWAEPLRWQNLHQWESKHGGVERGANFIRAKSDAQGLLILKDEDDGCPKELAPQVAQKLRGLNISFPVAYVLLKPEYEVLFLPCVAIMAGKPIGGRPGLQPGTVWDGESWEARRGVKEWLSKNFPKGRIYKPTTDQLPMTQMLDFDALRAADVPCFGSLERAISFLSNPLAGESVYPFLGHTTQRDV